MQGNHSDDRILGSFLAVDSVPDDVLDVGGTLAAKDLLGDGVEVSVVRQMVPTDDPGDKLIGGFDGRLTLVERLVRSEVAPKQRGRNYRSNR